MAMRLGGASPKSGEPSWKWRRLLIYATVIVCFWFIYLLMDKADTRVNDTIAWSLCMIISVLALGYTGLATAQDIAAIWTTRTARPYSDPPQEPTPPPPGDTQQTVIVQQAQAGRPEPDAPSGGE